MSQSHMIKGGTADEAFQELRCLWERRASNGVDFFKFQVLLHAQEPVNTEGKGERNKSLIALL